MSLSARLVDGGVFDGATAGVLARLAGSRDAVSACQQELMQHLNGVATDEHGPFTREKFASPRHCFVSKLAPPRSVLHVAASGA